MHVKRRTLPHFELLSAALFATLAMAAAQSARAQQPQAPAAATAPAPAPTAPAVSGAGSIPPNKWTADQIAEAFKRTDTNGDGNISRQEAAQWQGLSRRFDAVDTNKDGQLSNAEFNEALK